MYILLPDSHENKSDDDKIGKSQNGKINSMSIWALHRESRTWPFFPAIYIDLFVTPISASGPSGSSVEMEMNLENRFNDISLVGDTEDDDCCGENDPKGENRDDGFVPSPLVSLKAQLEKDKDDESLRKWKEKLLGSIDDYTNSQLEPEVTFLSLGIVSENSPEFTTTLPIDTEKQGKVIFTLKEGSDYHMRLTFRVKYNIVSGLTYSNTVWKGGFQVDQSNGMLGTFAPQHEPYTHILEEETIPSGVMARGIYKAKLKFEDDDRRCHMELDYAFEIKKR